MKKIAFYLLVVAPMLAFASTMKGAECWWCDYSESRGGLCNTIDGGHPSGKTECTVDHLTLECKTEGPQCGKAVGGGGGGGGGGGPLEPIAPCSDWWDDCGGDDY